MVANDSRGSCASTNGNYHSNNTNNNNNSSSSSSSRKNSMNLCSNKTALPLNSPITIVDMIYTMALVSHVRLTCRH